MSALIHARCHPSVPCDRRSSHITHSSFIYQQQLRQNLGVSIRAESSRSGFKSSRQHVRAGRRELLHSTALLTLPTLSRSDAQTSLQQPLSSSKQPVDSSNSTVSGSQDEEPVLACRPPNPVLRISAPGRIVAVGDIHGDLTKAIALFKLAGVVEERDRRVLWIGGDTTVIQLGDVLDRGSREIASLQLLRNLDQQARKQGGAVHMINGNHESLNVSGVFRYATPGGMLESAIMSGLRGVHAHLEPNQRLARQRLFAPGGHIAKELAHNATVLIVNDTLFAHGGVTMSHVQYGLERINAEVASWMRGDKLSNGSRAPPPFLAMGDKRSVMWTRMFSQEFKHFHEKYHACNQLGQVLRRTGCKRMIVGHTPQLNGMNSECDGQVWRVDVGMSSGVLNASPQALEILAAQPDSGKDVQINVLGVAGCPPQPPCRGRSPPIQSQHVGSIGATSRLR